MQLTLEIPDNKLSTFMELIKNLDFVKVNGKEESSPLSKRQMELVDIEVQKAKDNPESLMDWEDVKLRIDWDAC